MLSPETVFPQSTLIHKVTMKDTCNLVRVLHFYALDQGKIIPEELKDYLHFVAKTGDNIFTWSSLKYLFHELLRISLVNFYGGRPRGEFHGLKCGDFYISCWDFTLEFLKNYYNIILVIMYLIYHIVIFRTHLP